MKRSGEHRRASEDVYAALDLCGTRSGYIVLKVSRVAVIHIDRQQRVHMIAKPEENSSGIGSRLLDDRALALPNSRNRFGDIAINDQAQVGLAQEASLGFTQESFLSLCHAG